MHNIIQVGYQYSPGCMVFIGALSNVFPVIWNGLVPIHMVGSACNCLDTSNNINNITKITLQPTLIQYIAGIRVDFVKTV